MSASAVTRRFAVYLEKQFSGWAVDCNYDRLGERCTCRAVRSSQRTIIWENRSILMSLCVSARSRTTCSPSKSAIEPDQQKLKALIDPDVWFAYWIGVPLVLARTNVAAAEVYVGGVLDRTQNVRLTERLMETSLGRRMRA
jgi:hypothetical protein